MTQSIVSLYPAVSRSYAPAKDDQDVPFQVHAVASPAIETQYFALAHDTPLGCPAPYIP